MRKSVNLSTTGKSKFVCQCDCGEIKEVARLNLTTGITQSCGCKQKDAARRNTPYKVKHGHRLKAQGQASPEYYSWCAMLGRCRNPKDPAWKHYGGRGISVCTRWETFENFLADMGARPEGKTLDRYPNNDGNYEPTNCRWATPKEQAANKHRAA